MENYELRLQLVLLAISFQQDLFCLDCLMQVIALTEELLATAKHNEESGLVAQHNADASPEQETFSRISQYQVNELDGC
ncbi:uncharacterized protein A4U43_C01F12300 [Asparagus officinalis]|uniref:Uncharacterized protein n=1 Tax=Asparagus officinalis TaxID=4686 RepID=A0A5P1FPB8_ASPOF|nr:uncharacterized protein A4U43_C01F12300 [Asparagus officinalis]